MLAVLHRCRQDPSQARTSSEPIAPREHVVPPAGFEPAHLAPEASALSPELRGRSPSVRIALVTVEERRVPSYTSPRWVSR